MENRRLQLQVSDGLQLGRTENATTWNYRLSKLCHSFKGISLFFHMKAMREVHGTVLWNSSALSLQDSVTAEKSRLRYPLNNFLEKVALVALESECALHNSEKVPTSKLTEISVKTPRRTVYHTFKFTCKSFLDQRAKSEHSMNFFHAERNNFHIAYRSMPEELDSNYQCPF